MKIIQTSDSIIVNGVEHKLPKYVKRKTNRVTMIGGRITVNGFVFNPKTGEFKISFSLVWIIVIGGILAYLILD